jgi:hypothetical protein
MAEECNEPLGSIKRRTLRQCAEKLEEITAERDALREHLTRLIYAAELGLSFAECDLACEKIDFAGYPDKWELTESHVNFIKAAIAAAKGGAQ